MSNALPIRIRDAEDNDTDDIHAIHARQYGHHPNVDLDVVAHMMDRVHVLVAEDQNSGDVVGYSAYHDAGKTDEFTPIRVIDRCVVHPEALDQQVVRQLITNTIRAAGNTTICLVAMVLTEEEENGAQYLTTKHLFEPGGELPTHTYRPLDVFQREAVLFVRPPDTDKVDSSSEVLLESLGEDAVRFAIQHNLFTKLRS